MHSLSRTTAYLYESPFSSLSSSSSWAGGQRARKPGGLGGVSKQGAVGTGQALGVRAPQCFEGLAQDPPPSSPHCSALASLPSDVLGLAQPFSLQLVSWGEA